MLPKGTTLAGWQNSASGLGPEYMEHPYLFLP